MQREEGTGGTSSGLMPKQPSLLCTCIHLLWPSGASESTKPTFSHALVEDVSFKRTQVFQAQMENVIKDFGFCTPSYYHPEMLLLSLSQSQGGRSWGFCKATGTLLSLAFGSPGLHQTLAFQPCWFVVSPNEDHHCHGHLAMWAGGYVCIKGWLSFGLYMPFAIRLLIPLNVRLGGKKKKDQIKEGLRLLAVS